MEIKIVAEASTKLQRLFIGWGVSFLIDGDLLFDTFSSEKVIRRNFLEMNIDVQQLKYVVISHEHWDHYGGLWYVLGENHNIEVFICPGFSDEFKKRIEQFGVRIKETNQITEIKENIFTTGEIMGQYGGKPLPEQSLILKSKKISIVTGCSHPGIIEIIKKVKNHFTEPVDLVLGGFHLHDKPLSGLIQIVSEFKNLGIERVAPCHCTGKKAVELFQQEFKDNFIEVYTGSKIQI